MKSKSVVLLSSGLDSSVNLAWAHQETDVVCALTFDYGQVSAQKEITNSKSLCDLFGIQHEVIDLKWFHKFSKSSLNHGKGIPLSQEVFIEDLSISQKTAKSVWVPNRNGIFLNVAAGFAEGLGADWVIAGFNREEATTFPDNSADFLKATDQTFLFSTATQVKTKCYTIDMDKTEIVKQALRLKLDLRKVWPCYQNLETWCGQCESCQRFGRALKSNGLSMENLK